MISVAQARSMKKFVTDRPFADPDAAARKLIEIANGVEAAGRSDLHRAGERAVSCSRRQWRRLPRRHQVRHRSGLDLDAQSGTYVKFTDAGAALFA